MTRTLTRCTSVEPAPERADVANKVWFFFACVLFMIVLAAAVDGSLAHPYGIRWDEAQYLNEIQIDGQRLRTGHLLNLFGRIGKGNFRPPAYRLLALPIVGV